MENLLGFVTKERCFKSHHSIITKPPSSLHFLRESAQVVSHSCGMAFLLLNHNKGKMWLEGEFQHTPKLQMNVYSVVGARSVQAAVDIKKRRKGVAKG